MRSHDLAQLATVDIGETVLDTGLMYDGVTPVRIRVRKRGPRYEFSDDGGAVDAAGIDVDQIAFDDQIQLGAYSVNVSSRGVVSLPGFEGSSDDWLDKLPALVAEGSVALYEGLLELDS